MLLFKENFVLRDPSVGPEVRDTSSESQEHFHTYAVDFAQIEGKSREEATDMKSLQELENMKRQILTLNLPTDKYSGERQLTWLAWYERVINSDGASAKKWEDLRKKLDENKGPDLKEVLAGTAAQTSALKTEISNGNELVSSLELQIPQELLQNTTVLALLKQHGIIISDRGVIENPERCEKFKEYIELLTFITTVERDRNQKINPEGKKTLVDNYLALQENTNDTIWDKKYMAMKYADAMVSDVIAEGYYLHKDDNGNFTIQSPNKAGNIDASKFAPAGSSVAVYERMLKGTHIDSSMLDVATLSHIMSKDTILRDGEITGEKEFFQRMLDKHGITADGANRTLKAEQLLLHKDHVLETITAKKDALFESGRNGDAPDNMTAYQELTFLENYIGKEGEEGGYLNKEYNKAIFSEVETFRHKFLKEKALIDAFGGNNTEATEETYGDMLKSLQMPAAMLGLLLLIFKGTRKFGVGLLSAAIVASPVAKFIDKAVAKGDDAFNLSDSKLDLIRPGEVIHNMNPDYSDDYGNQFKKLQKLNNENVIAGGEGENGASIDTISDNKLIADIVNDIAIGQINADVAGLTGADLLTKLKRVNNNPTYTVDDLNAFIGLINSPGFKDEDDKTLLDYLSKGKDILNEAYDGPTLTGQNDIDGLLNAELLILWNAEGKTDIEKRTIREDILEAKKILSKEMSDTRTFLSNARNGFGNIVAVFTENGQQSSYMSFNSEERVNNIVNKIEEINSGINSSLKPILDNFKKYEKTEKQLAKYEGFIDENIDNVREKWNNLLGIGSNTLETEGNARIRDELGSQIELLKKIDIDENDEPFKGLSERRDAQVRRMESMQSRLDQLTSATPDVLTQGRIDHLLASDMVAMEGLLSSMLNKVEGAIGTGITILTVHSILEDNLSDYKDYESIKTALDGVSTTDTATVNAKAYLSQLTEKYAELKPEIESKIKAYSDEIGTLKNQASDINFSSNFQDTLSTYKEVQTKIINVDDIDVDGIVDIGTQFDMNFGTINKKSDLEAVMENKLAEMENELGNHLTTLERSIPHANIDALNTDYNSLTDILGMLDVTSQNKEKVRNLKTKMVKEYLENSMSLPATHNFDNYKEIYSQIQSFKDTEPSLNILGAMLSVSDEYKNNTKMKDSGDYLFGKVEEKENEYEAVTGSLNTIQNMTISEFFNKLSTDTSLAVDIPYYEAMIDENFNS